MQRTTLTLAALALGLSACSSNFLDPGRQAAADLAGTGGDAATPGAGGLDAIQQSSVAFFQTEVGDRVLFTVDQSTLTPEAVLVLDAQAAWLNANTDFTARIEGHADEQGTREYNIGLGDRRANAVLNYLVSRGVASNRLSTVSFGKEKPLAVCSDESCWSQNRRAVTVVAGGFTG